LVDISGSHGCENEDDSPQVSQKLIDVSEVISASIIRAALKPRSTSTTLHGTTLQKTVIFGELVTVIRPTTKIAYKYHVTNLL
jgi:hypothetical protein